MLPLIDRLTGGVFVGFWIAPLLHLWIEKAMRLLTSFGRTLAEIALECGFADQSHFTRVFRETIDLHKTKCLVLYD